MLRAYLRMLKWINDLKTITLNVQKDKGKNPLRIYGQMVNVFLITIDNYIIK